MKLARTQSQISLCQTISSRMPEVDSLCLKVRDLFYDNDLGEVCFGVELLARECLSNAVIHGNKSIADKSIRLCLSVGSVWIRLEVSDEGEGFDWRKVRRNRSDSTETSGRGIELYALYAARMRFSRRGNQITLWIPKVKRTGKDDHEMAAYLIEQKDQQGSVKLTGDLTAVLVPDLQAGLKDLLNQGARELVFDLAAAKMLDSSGIGLLIASANSLDPCGGKVRVTNVSPDIFRLLQSMRLTTRLNVSARQA
jgi:serine/threonine-protein kinase RsbW